MDLDVLGATLETYLGEHNFRCFTGKEADVDGYRRTIKSVSLGEEGGEYRIELKATGFMRYMVRMMLGVAFRVAAGKLGPDYIAARFRDPSLGPVPYMAPAEGLYLKEVLYK